MNKKLKMVLVTLVILIGIVLLDTFQAKIFNNSPIIKITKTYSENYKKDIGILVETKIYKGVSKKTLFKWETTTKPIINNDDIEKQLNDVNEKIKKYFSSDIVEYYNLSFNYVDLAKKRVIVGLYNNDEKQQEKFKKLVVDSELIEFVQGENKLEDYDNIEECLGSLLGGFITSEVITPEEKSLSDIIDVDMTKISYSKAKVTTNGLIYVIVKTNDNSIVESLDDYFEENYSGYTKSVFDGTYYIYLYNSFNDIELDKYLDNCKKN